MIQRFYVPLIVLAFVLSPVYGSDVKPDKRASDAPSTRPQFRHYKHPVTIWIPSYAIAKCQEQLDTNPAIADAITHLALQFWQPTSTGGVELVTKWQANPAAVASLRDWARARGVRAMLCIYNAAGGKWDWPLARAAFADHPDELVKNLVAEVERHNLDGVDLDLEGIGSFDADKDAYILFVEKLAAALRQRNKQLTVDTFAYKWNAPNQSWWPDLFPHVDGIASMGYEETGSTAPEWHAYAAQRDAAGVHANKLQIGMPSSKDAWHGNTAIEQLNWVREDGKTGVAIWDAQLRGSAWRKRELWDILQDIRTIPNEAGR
jgi:hypothetical protein